MGLKKGQCNNLHGRPKLGLAISPFLRAEGLKFEILNYDGNKIKKTKNEWLAMRIWQEALKGDYNFGKLLLNYLDGMPVQQVLIEPNGDLSPYDLSKIDKNDLLKIKELQEKYKSKKEETNNNAKDNSNNHYGK